MFVASNNNNKIPITNFTNLVAGMSDAKILCEYLFNMVGKQKSNWSKCWDIKRRQKYQSVLNINVQAIYVGKNEKCSANRRPCQRSFDEKVKTALEGMSETKASHMQNWIAKTFGH